MTTPPASGHLDADVDDTPSTGLIDLVRNNSDEAARVRRPPRSRMTAAVLAMGFPPTGVPAVLEASRSRAARRAGDNNAARAHAARAGQWVAYSASALFVIAVMASAWLFLTANNASVVDKFFNVEVLKTSMPEVLGGFWLNIKLSLITEAIVLVWALVVALARLLPGRPALTVRVVATFYIDVFRGFPAVIVLYLIAFGLPLTKLPVVSDLSLFSLCVIGLTLVYGAYVAEVYRAGIESIHPSQMAAARSLGLSYPRALFHVILPQAIRRIVPPLLNDFISLQKDTSLVAVVGLLDGFNLARIHAGNEFNLSAVTGVGLAFVAVTIPLARIVDYSVRRNERRSRTA